MKKHPNCSHKLLITISSGCHDLSSLLLTHSWFTHSVPVGSKTRTNPSGMAVWTTVEAAQTEGGSNWNPRQTIPQNCEQKQMQGSSCVYNWFSRAASCCQSLSNKLSPGALVLINHGASDAPAPPFFTRDGTIQKYQDQAVEWDYLKRSWSHEVSSIHKKGDC